MAQDMEAQKAEKEKNEKKRMGQEEKEPKVVPGVYAKDGRIRSVLPLP